MKLLPLLAVGAMLPAVESHSVLADPLLTECSGLVASRTHAGVLWSHNDSGNRCELFAVGEDGRSIARLAVDAVMDDCEDIAIAADGIYLADVGDNRARRSSISVYRIAEPDPLRAPAAPLPVAQRWQLTYPDGPHDCEALVVLDGFGYLIDKRIGVAQIWRFACAGAAEQVLEHVGSLPIPAPVTGADCSVDGKWLAVSHPFGAHVLPLPQGIASADVAQATLIPLPMQLKREAVAFGADGIFIATETRDLDWRPATWLPKP